jgi:hypothetical protein
VPLALKVTTALTGCVVLVVVELVVVVVVVAGCGVVVVVVVLVVIEAKGNVKDVLLVPTNKLLAPTFPEATTSHVSK